LINPVLVIEIELKRAFWFGASLLLVFYVSLALLQSSPNNPQWLLQSVLVWSFCIQQTWQRRALNCPAVGTTVFPDLGWANRLTLLRGWLLACCAGFLFQPKSDTLITWLPALLYSLAAIFDRLDGYLARRYKHVSILGNELDTVFDALGLLVAPLLAVSYGKIHWSYLLVSVAWYLFQWGLYWRRQQALPVYPLVPNRIRRALAGFQMGFIAMVLWPQFQPPLTMMIGLSFMLPFLLGFTMDWLVVSGRLAENSKRFALFLSKLEILSRCFFQPALRLLLALGLVLMETTTEFGLFISNNFAYADTLLCFSLLLSAAMIVTGLAGRVGALLLVVLLAWFAPELNLNNHSSPFLQVVICSAVWILLLGCGRWSLWVQDDVWVHRVDGT